MYVLYVESDPGSMLRDVFATQSLPAKVGRDLFFFGSSCAVTSVFVRVLRLVCDNKLIEVG